VTTEIQAPVNLLEEISAFCKTERIAESTFGKRAVNDGKFVARLKDGARVTPETWDRVTGFLEKNGWQTLQPPKADSLHLLSVDGGNSTAVAERAEIRNGSQARNFRFFDNRQKYLLFVNTCSEKEIVAARVGKELAHLHPSPPALRLFDGGMGDGTVLSAVMREMHTRFPTLPFYISGKEISLEDVRLSFAKMADRFLEHPATVLVITNMYYSEAPWLSPRRVESANSLVWKNVALTGTTAHEFNKQFHDLEGFLAEYWQAGHSEKTGNPIYERPAVLVIYREDYRFLLDDVIPEPGKARADFDLVIASQPYRARVSAEFKAEKVIGPLTRALRKGGRLIGIHSCGNDPGMEIIHRVWPDEEPFKVDRHDILRALRKYLGKDSRHYNLNVYADSRSIFRYDMHTLPNEVESSIGTSTLFAAWNAAVYVAQIEDERLSAVVKSGQYLEATESTLKAHSGLWFYDESYVVSKKRD
tara:strand:- start:1094 stop:2515 length:1422 start_codon:yes stop_codon:yes gene_type:complete